MINIEELSDINLSLKLDSNSLLVSMDQRVSQRRSLPGAMEAAERTARQKEQAEKDKIERMNADLKEVWRHHATCIVQYLLFIVLCTILYIKLYDI